MNVFFDLDGTLTDPAEGIVSCIQHALASLHIDIDEREDLESFIGPPLQQTLRYLCGSDELAERAVGLYRERFARVGLYENRLHEGIRECLEGLVSAGRCCYVVTSKPTGFSKRIVEHFEIHPYFKAVYGSNLDGTLGDKADLLAHVLREEKIEPAEAVMIGDRKFDIAGARHHGMRSIGVLWGYGSERELQEAGADSICDNPERLIDHILQ
ncbi:MAG: phosphoglycolate phosphatase [Halieaceae bacterium]|jgi:phosphoglycolate phosphatase